MATYYVSGQNGNDASAGTSVATAKKTIDSGLSLCSSDGDILIIGPGTYREVLTNGDFSGMGGTTPGNEGKVIGDPDASHFTDDKPGPVRITKKDIDEVDTSTNSAAPVTVATNHLHFHNIIFEGAASNNHSTTGTST